MIFLGLSELFGGPVSEPSKRFGGPQESTQPLAGAQEASCGLTEASGETVLTPALIEIYYQTQPKRLYTVNGQEVPSVTNVLKVLDKPALSWWGMKTGIAGVKQLEGVDYMSEEEILAQLVEKKLTVNHVRDKAGDRGKSVHTAFELWAETGDLPDPDVYPESEWGYISALTKFLTEAKLEPLRSEVMVGSLQYGYAGRYDLQAYYGGHEVVTHLTPKKERRGELCEPGLGLFDLKTSSGIYPETHYRQLEAYEKASVECGYDPTDFRAVVQVCADGRYQVKLSTAVFEDFKHVLDVYNDNQRLKGKT